MAAFTFHALALLFLEHDDFIAAFVFENFGGDGGTSDARGAHFVTFAFASGEHVSNFYSRAFFCAGIAVDDKDVALGNSELLSLGFDGGFQK